MLYDMKPNRRKLTSLKPEIEAILNQQVKMEANASSKYLAMASWCDTHGYKNSANYFYTQSDEEKMHMMKIFKFIITAGGHALTPEVPQPQIEFENLRACFELALQSEIGVTESINKIVTASREALDFATEQLALWFVNEQIEEEFVARRALEVFDLMEGETIYTIDTELGGIREAANELDAAAN